MILFDVLKRAMVTEKASALKADARKVTLEVARWANKKQIKEAAQSLFKVKVENVHTANYRGKTKRVKASMGKQSNWKKAVLTLEEGSDLDVFGVAAQVPPSGEQA